MSELKKDIFKVLRKCFPINTDGELDEIAEAIVHKLTVNKHVKPKVKQEKIPYKIYHGRAIL